MRAVDLAKIFWALVCVVEVQDLLCWHYRIEVAEDEEDGKMSAKFFEDAEIVYGEDVEAYLLIGSLFYHVQKRTK